MVKDLKNILSKLSFGAIELPENPNQPKISGSAVAKILEQRPRRVCFESTHQNALKEKAGEKWAGSFSVPFRESVYPLFHKMTGLELWHSKDHGNWWRSLKTPNEVETVRNWIAAVRPLVFLRDTLALSIALAEHQVSEGGRSAIGELEKRAKYDGDRAAIEHLTARCVQTINTLPYYSDVDAVCAIPPRQGKGFDLPTEIVARLAKALSKPDLTSLFNWINKKPSLKDEKFEKKWATLEAVGLKCNTELNKKKVLLLDDLYQSGITIQFVAMELLNAGATRVYGLTLVKSRRDSDNA